MSRNFLEIFSRYEPKAEDAELLLSADADTIQLRADKPQRLIEASAAFPRVISIRTLYKIEEEIRQTYELNMVRLCPRFPSACFSIDSIPDILIETNRRGIVAKGFFDHCGELIKLPFAIHITTGTPKTLQSLPSAPSKRSFTPAKENLASG